MKKNKKNQCLEKHFFPIHEFFPDWKCSAMFGAIYHANTLELVDYDAQNKNTEMNSIFVCSNIPSHC